MMWTCPFPAAESNIARWPNVVLCEKADAGRSEDDKAKMKKLWVDIAILFLAIGIKNANVLNISVFDALSIDSGLVTAV